MIKINFEVHNDSEGLSISPHDSYAFPENAGIDLVMSALSFLLKASVTDGDGFSASTGVITMRTDTQYWMETTFEDVFSAVRGAILFDNSRVVGCSFGPHDEEEFGFGYTVDRVIEGEEIVNDDSRQIALSMAKALLSRDDVKLRSFSMYLNKKGRYEIVCEAEGDGPPDGSEDESSDSESHHEPEWVRSRRALKRSLENRKEVIQNVGLEPAF